MEREQKKVSRMSEQDSGSDCDEDVGVEGGRGWGRGGWEKPEGERKASRLGPGRRGSGGFDTVSPTLL